MSDCSSCDRTIGMFDDHAVTLCGDCYHALVREKHELEEKLRAYQRREEELSEAFNSRNGSYHP